MTGGTMKKLFIIFLVSLFFLLLPVDVSANEVRDFKYYATHLSENLYPKINSILDNYKRPLKNRDILIIEQQVVEEVKNYLIDSKIPVMRFPIIEIMLAENIEYKGWLLLIQIRVLDEEESIEAKAITWSLFGKTFIIYLLDKNELET